MTNRALGEFAFAGFVGGFVLVVLLEAGCTPKVPARELARSAVVVTAEAAKAADEVCARVALERDDLELARKCEAAYDSARRHLLATATAVDTWDRFESSRESVTCAVLAAAGDLQAVAELLAARHVELPPIAADARTLVAALGRCVEPGQ